MYIKSGTAMPTSKAATTILKVVVISNAETTAAPVPAGPGTQTAGLPGSWAYKRCYSDNVYGRALFWQIVLDTNNTAASCLSLCSQYGYMTPGMG